MRRRYTVLLFGMLIGLVGFANGAGAQGIHAISSLDGTDVICVGDNGVVYRSFDGGLSYLNLPVGSASLRGVARNGLTLVMVADGGNIWRSTNNGGAWSSQAPAGAVNLRGVAMPSGSAAYVVGAAGTILKSIDGGASWNPQTSGVGVQLNAVRFTDDSNGWAVGDGGTVLQTVDGGANWVPVAVGTTGDLLAVDVSGSTIWVVGARGVALKSDTGGASWNFVNLRLDARSDVRAVYLSSPTDVYLGGGGGFIRRSTDGGVNWTFQQSQLQSPLDALYFHGSVGWATARGTRAILRTTDGGTTWNFATGTSISRSWTQKLSAGSVHGKSIEINPVYPSTMYSIYGGSVYRSRDDGETWSSIATIPSTSMPNSFAVSPKDSNTWVAVVRSPMRIVKTTNAGANWTTTLTPPNGFGDYGIPLEMHPDKPDTLFFGADGSQLYRSTDFGSTWALYGNTSFRSPCDIVVVPESDSAVIQVGDGITSQGQWQLWRSNDGGVNFKSILTGSSSETPGMAGSRLRPNTTFATHWSSNGVHRTTNGGLSWTTVSSVGSAWGVDIAKDDPNCVIFGTYGGTSGYLALDGGAGPSSFVSTGLSGTNYSFLARDRATILAYMSNGIYKLNVSYSYTPTTVQALTLSSPNGGEVWDGGSVHDVTWSATNIGLARIEYRTGPADPWTLIAEVPGLQGSYAWTLPNTPTTTAEVRVRDAWDNNPEDVSNVVFTISVPGLLAGPGPIDLGLVQIGQVVGSVINLENTGNTTVHIINTSVFSPEFWLGRQNLSLGAGATDTLGIFYSPLDVGPDTATVYITADDPVGVHSVIVTGEGSSTTGTDDRLPVAFAAWQNQPNPFSGMTRIRYALPQRAEVSLDVYNVLGQRVASLVHETQEPGVYSVPFGSGAFAISGRARTLTSGVYFYQFKAGPYSATRKMLMLH